MRVPALLRRLLGRGRPPVRPASLVELFGDPAQLPLALSTRPTHRHYDPELMGLPVLVTLNGREIDRCVSYDIPAGLVEFYPAGSATPAFLSGTVAARVARPEEVRR